MRKLKMESHYSDAELKEILNNQTTVRIFQDWQIIYLVQTNKDKTAEEIAIILGINKSKVYRIIQEYNKQGKLWKPYDNWGGRREKRCLFSLAEEAEILKEIEEDALLGKILIYKHVKSIIEKRANKSVSDDYIWDLFKRHGWSKKVPRQHHPKRNEQDQIEYKKNLKRIWLPNH